MTSPFPRRLGRLPSVPTPTALCVTVAVALAGCSTTTAGAEPSRPLGAAAPPSPAGPGNVGAPGLGDPYFPDEGNGGYDVARYDLDIGYEPSRDRLTGVATLTMTAGHALRRFNLDLAGLTVSKVTVDGRAAEHRQDDDELIVTPSRTVPQGRRFRTVVTYAGTPRPAGGSGALGRYGWQHTDDGAIVASQPNGAQTWFPANDHPRDKAAFSFTVDVPGGLWAVAPGRLVRRENEGARTVHEWDAPEPMVTYLASVAIGRYDVRQGRTPRGIPMITAVDPASPGNPARFAADTGRLTDELTALLGPYPFGSTGGTVDAQRTGYALEVQTRSVYGGFDPDGEIIAHELAHQWFGNSVSLTQWHDIWLNEGLATYVQWVSEAAAGGPAVDDIMADLCRRSADDDWWKVRPGDPGATRLFAEQVYDRGGMTLLALRRELGAPMLHRILRTWAARHRHGSASTPRFIALAEELSGRQLDALFDAWLYTPAKPEDC
ncbi:MAG: M1 family peptidase [Streptosporangiales bacterium]|nr:M1 family peptidase [Streptosporangiales bacterium]